MTTSPKSDEAGELVAGAFVEAVVVVVAGAFVEAVVVAESSMGGEAAGNSDVAFVVVVSSTVVGDEGSEGVSEAVGASTDEVSEVVGDIGVIEVSGVTEAIEGITDGALDATTVGIVGGEDTGVSITGATSDVGLGLSRWRMERAGSRGNMLMKTYATPYG